MGLGEGVGGRMKVEDLVALWNESVGEGFPKVEGGIDVRKVDVYEEALRRHGDKGWWRKVIKKVKGIPVLSGRNLRRVFVDLEFVVRHGEEIMGGVYDGLKIR